jgi:hypothetical protein
MNESSALFFWPLVAVCATAAHPGQRCTPSSLTLMSRMACRGVP